MPGVRGGRWATAGPERGHNGITGLYQKFAHNFPRSVFKHRSKRCNSNDVNSKFEAAAGELRATLSRNHACDRPRGPDLSSSVHVKDRVSACVTVTDDEPRSRCTASKNTGNTANRNTSGAASKNTGGPANRNTGGAAARTPVHSQQEPRQHDKPGGESPPPGLYARITCR